MRLTADGPPRASLERFAAWLAEVSPFHGAVRTPVYLEPDAPALIRAFWDLVGWSEVVGTGGTPAPVRPERVFSDREALRVVRGWLSSPDLRDRWGVSDRSEVERALHARLPARTRFVLASREGVNFTDETTGSADPPVLRLRESGRSEPRWPSYIEMVMWQTCATIGARRGAALRRPASAGGTSLEQPFAPALTGLWTLADGVWGLGPFPGLPATGPRQGWERVVFRSLECYFRFMRALPDGEIDSYAAPADSTTRFWVTGPAADPESAALQGLRRFQVRGPSGAAELTCGLVEADGVRIWLEKRQGAGRTTVFAEPEQAAAVRAWLDRAKVQIDQERAPAPDRHARLPTDAEAAAARELHDRARAAAEGTTT